jgi:hypothetical protein
VLAAGLTVWLVASAGLASPPYPTCFGAAARDPVHACNNPKLKLAVIPTPAEAQVMPNTPCTPIEAPIDVCLFGAPATTAGGAIALLGDSHAWHWRGAVDYVARALHRRGLSITHSLCPFTEGLPLLPEPKGAECVLWNQAVLQWFAQHPEISTVFTSDHPVSVTNSPGQSHLAAQVAGITAAWRALPATVKHIIVIRDIPDVYEATLACVEGAIAKREDAGNACAVARSVALHQDPDVVAAQRLRSPRFHVTDLTHFFCDSRRCYPVVGGALVYRDSHHLTGIFATTLGPFLLHLLGRLMASWH